MSPTSTSSSAAQSLRVPPYSSEAERGVLGSILLDSGKDSRVLDLCTENALTLNERLRSLNRLDTIGGTA